MTRSTGWAMAEAGYGSGELRQRGPKDLKAVQVANRELDAFKAWVVAGGDEEAARKALGLSEREARVLINRGMERYRKERMNDLDALRARQLVELEMMRRPTLQRAVEGVSQATNDMIRIQERESKLMGLDAQRKDEGPQIILVDTRMPWDRGDPAPEAIEGEVVEPPDEHGSTIPGAADEPG